MRKIAKKSYLLISVFMLILLAACSGNGTVPASGDSSKNTGGPVSAKIGVISIFIRTWCSIWRSDHKWFQISTR